MFNTCFQESEQDRILTLPIDDIKPSPENDKLYRPIDPKDPEIVTLSKSIREFGLQEPLSVTRDGYIISGHRRYAALSLAGITHVNCRVHSFRKDDDHDRVMKLLRECNRQRNKSFEEKLREEIISTDPEEAYLALLAHRRKASQLNVSDLVIDLRATKRRAKITSAKAPFLAAIRKVLDERRDFWPLSDRQIHYALLNAPPLKHASKPNSAYSNDDKSYKALTELLTRARLCGMIPMEAIADPTRPVTNWDVYSDVQDFLRDGMDQLFTGYWRDLMVSQPNHIEIMVEKNTVEPIIRQVAARFTIPMTSGRGFMSIPPRYEIVERYRASGKERLILLMMSDFDPDGEEIAHSLARSLRDEFGVQKIEPIKVALCAKHVTEFNLPPILKAKKSSPNRKEFVKKHGNVVHELEAIEPRELQRLLTEAIDAVIDMDAFNNELAQEKQDSVKLAAARRRVRQALSRMPGNDSDNLGCGA